MYNLPYYKEHNPQVILDFIARYPFAFVSGCNENNHPVATQLPVFIEEHNGKQFLRGHLMKDTDHHKAFMCNPNVLVVFTGHHTYVSGTWYSNPHIASTWNYMSVHVHGTIKFFEGAELMNVLRKTSLHFENNNENSSTVLDNLPDEFVHKVTPYIVGFEIEVLSMEHVFKLSQDRDLVSYKNIIEKLKAQDEAGRVIAHEMEIRLEELFNGRSK
jgi:transcriptional regulator